MATKHTPATPLPWFAGQLKNAMADDDAMFCVHAANAYPRLVEALREIISARDVVKLSVHHYHKNRAEVERDAKAAAVARALLRELGEE